MKDNVDSIVNKSKNQGLRTLKAFLFILVILVLALTIIYYPKNIPFWQFNASDVVILLISLFLIATFIERAVEVVIVVWRDKDKKEIENVIETERKKSVLKAKEGTRTITQEEEQAVNEYVNYKADTKSLAMPLAFAMGIIISALGIKSLQPLVDPAVFKALTVLQKSLFTGIDTLITGALLGGGSKGIHEIIEAFLNTVEKYRENLKEK
jgi:hypothetical protein